MCEFIGFGDGMWVKCCYSEGRLLAVVVYFDGAI